MDHRPPEHSDPTAPIVKAGRKATRFSKEFAATLIAMVSTAIGVVVALAWNEALQAAFAAWFPSTGALAVAKLVYAVLITAVGVLIILSLGKLALRLNAEPIEFKYPVPKKDKESD
ncbi:MAG: hypothetical protein HY240_03960 [Actinobacteria bacterium]|nr:hypothetical protein [Actinomycetota bacterium]